MTLYGKLVFIMTRNKIIIKCQGNLQEEDELLLETGAEDEDEIGELLDGDKDAVMC